VTVLSLDFCLKTFPGCSPDQLVYDKLILSDRKVVIDLDMDGSIYFIQGGLVNNMCQILI